MAKKLEAWEKKWQAEEDVRALTRVQELEGAPGRLKAAKTLATQQAAEHAKAANLAKKVARKAAPPKRAPTRRGSRKR